MNSARPVNTEQQTKQKLRSLVHYEVDRGENVIVLPTGRRSMQGSVM